MSTAALLNVYEDIRSYNLSAANMRWLAARLIEAADSKAPLQPYTIDEIYARIAQSEEDIAKGRVHTMQEARQIRKKHLAKLLNHANCVRDNNRISIQLAPTA